MPSSAPAVPLPRQIPFIIANEGCERFSFYGMRNILTPFLISALPGPPGRRPDRAGAGQGRLRTFFMEGRSTFFPLAGAAWLSRIAAVWQGWTLRLWGLSRRL